MVTRSYAYPVASFGRFMSDHVRMDAYVKALRQVIEPDSVVLNIGTGTGLFAFLAVQMGARRVIAVETNNVIILAQQIAEANGLADRIEFHQSMSTSLTLDEPADVIVSDLRGALPLFEHHIPTVIDACERLLAPGGILIPRQDTLWAALARVPAYYDRRYDRPWTHNDFGLDMTPARDLLINDWQRVYLRPNQLASAPVPVATLDYRTIDTPNVRATSTWAIDRRQTLHGFVLWFDAQIHGEHGFSNKPGEPQLIYGQAFFPFEHPVAARPGDTIAVDVAAEFFDGEYIWKWVTTVIGPSGDTQTSYRQSTIWHYLNKKAELTVTQGNPPDLSSPQNH